MGSPKRRSLIVGFGHAGRDLHLRCLRKAWVRYRDEDIFDETVGVVERRAAERGFQWREEFAVFPALSEVRGFDPDVTVVHICTAPPDHLPAFREVAARGYRKILVEKPVTTSEWELLEILDLAQRRALDIQVAANWLSSSLTARLSDLVTSGRFGRLLALRVEQHKPRFTRTLMHRHHRTAFEVEMPHQVALALYLGGTDSKLLNAATSPMRVDGMTIPHMGTAEIRLLHGNRIPSLLQSDLTATIRMRTVNLRFPDCHVVGYYPVSADDDYSRLTITDPASRPLESELMVDDPMTTWLRDCYRHFAGRGPRPSSDLRFAAEVVSIICQAKALCGVE